MNQAVTDGGRNPAYGGCFPDETPEMHLIRLAQARRIAMLGTSNAHFTERIIELEADLAAAQAERDALRERANALLHQIDIGDYVDSEGHALKNNIAVLTLMKALTNV